MKDEKRPKLVRIPGLIIRVLAIVAVWVIVILDINVWRHLTGAAVIVDLTLAVVLTFSLAYIS